MFVLMKRILLLLNVLLMKQKNAEYQLVVKLPRALRKKSPMRNTLDTVQRLKIETENKRKPQSRGFFTA